VSTPQPHQNGQIEARPLAHIRGNVASGSEIAQREGLHRAMVNELLRLTLLEPTIIQSILAGQQPRCMSRLSFQRNSLPTDWVAQREILAQLDA